MRVNEGLSLTTLQCWCEFSNLLNYKVMLLPKVELSINSLRFDTWSRRMICRGLLHWLVLGIYLSFLSHIPAISQFIALNLLLTSCFLLTLKWGYYLCEDPQWHDQLIVELLHHWFWSCMCLCVHIFNHKNTTSTMARTEVHCIILLILYIFTPFLNIVLPRIATAPMNDHFD